MSGCQLSEKFGFALFTLDAILSILFREWSLITGKGWGEATKWEGFTPTKGGGRKKF